MNHHIIPDDTILNKIFLFRGCKVMLDTDLANLYGVETKHLNQAVNRNLKRFPSDFMFQLNEVEFDILKNQNGTSSWGGKRKLPYVFTEQGLSMLSGVLNSDRAIAVNIQIMRIFASVRQALMDNTELRLEIEKIKSKINNQDKNMEIIFRYLDELVAKAQPSENKRQRIGYKPDN